MKSPEKSQLVKHILGGSLNFDHRYIPNREVLVSVIKILKDAGYRIVLTQGVYDLFHVGHKRYLEHAKSHGDILVIGVDTDELTRKMKGPNRPFDQLNDRLEILASLRAVDIVTVRDHDEHMYDLIRTIRPDVLIMSHTTKTFSEKDRMNLMKYCGEIQVLPAQASTTTTAKLRRMMIDGAEQLAVKITDLINEFLIGIKNEGSSSVSSSGAQGTPRVSKKPAASSAVRAGKKPNKRVSSSR